jgi:flagellin-like protein
MSTTIIQKRRAVSPVIATVILIAVAVALGIAVAFWASGLTSSFSKYEKLGVSTQYAVSGAPNLYNSGKCDTSSICWTVNLGGQNTGSSDATITQIQVNGVPYPISSNGTSASGVFIEWGNQAGSGGKSSLSVPSGSTFRISFLLESATSSGGYNTFSSKTFSSGQTVQVTIITASGNNYPASIVLP